MKLLAFSSSFLAAALLLSACGSTASSETTPDSSSEPSSSVSVADSSEDTSLSNPEYSDSDLVYRGIVTALSEDSLEVQQMHGHNYGQDAILFHIDDQTSINSNGLELAEGNYVEVIYSGVLTRSIPPQGTANRINILSAQSDGIILNAVVLGVEDIDDVYKLDVLPFEGEEVPTEEEIQQASPDDHVFLIVAPESLKKITADELEGSAVSAVTQGIAALSMPPQIPVHVLLPYSDKDADGCNTCI